jgi:hypothetical protein
VFVKSILAEIREGDINFHDGKESLLLRDMGFSNGKFHAVM